VTDAKTRKQKFDEMQDVIERIRASLADIPDEELQREIDKATRGAREETNRLLKKSKTA
jgi:hypothetical protein